MEITFNQVDVAKLNLGPDDVLVVTVKAKDSDAGGLSHFADSLRETFDKNKVVVVGMGTNDEMAFTVVRESTQTNYCSDCDCGKRQGTENGLS